MEEVVHAVVSVADLDADHAVLFDVVLPDGFVLVDAYAEQDEVVLLELFGDGLDVVEVAGAGAAPGGPEIDEDDLAGERVEGNGGSVGSGEGELGGFVVGGQGG